MGVFASREPVGKGHDAKTWLHEAQNRPPPPDVDVPLDKVLAAHAAVPRTGTTQRLVVLSLGGSFCPVHREHVRVLERAKRALEARDADVSVLCGFLVPTSDAYLRRKLGDAAMPLAARVALCRAATAARADADVFPHGWANAFSAGDVIARVASARLGARVDAVPVYGADFAERAHSWRQLTDVHVCVGRPGHTAAVRRELAAHNAEAERVGAPASGLIVVDDELDDISSTRVRALVARRAWAELAESGDLPDAVLTGLRAVSEENDNDNEND